MADEAVDQRTIWTRLNLGFKVQKSSALLADDDLFTVYGQVLLTLVYGEVTGVCDAGPTTVLLNEQASSIPLCAATTVDADAVGEIYWLTGDPAIVLNGTGNTPVLKVAALLSAFQHCPIIFDGQAGLVIETTCTGADATGVVLWTLFYLPLEPGAYVTAAA